MSNENEGVGAVNSKGSVLSILRNSEFRKKASEKDECWIVAQGLNGFTYTGKFVMYNEQENSMTVEYKRDGLPPIKSDIFLHGLCSIQLSSYEEIKQIRETKSKGK